MILLSATFKGLTRFADERRVDFAKFGPGLFAIAAPNGAGKTTLVDASLPAPLFRECPSRATLDRPLARNFPSGEGHVVLEFRLDDGRTYRSEVTVKRGEVDVAKLSVDGKMLAKSKREHGDEVQRLLGHKDAIYASVYGIQGGDGAIGDLDVAQRRAVFRQYLQTDRYVKMKKAVDERLRILAEATKGLAEAQADASWLEGEVSETDRLRREAVAVSHRLERERDEAKRAYDAVRDLAAHLAKQQAWRDKVRTLEQQMESALAQAAEAEAIYDRCEAVLQVAVVAPESAEALRAVLDVATQAEIDLTRQATVLASLQRSIAQAERSEALLGRVPCQGRGPYAACELLADARQAVVDLLVWRNDVAPLRAKVDDLQAQASRKPEARKRYEQAERRYRAYLQQQADRQVVEAKRDAALQAIERHGEIYERAEAELATLGPEPAVESGVTRETLLNREAELQEAEKRYGDAIKRIAMLEGQGKQHEDTLVRLRVKIAEMESNAKREDQDALRLLSEAFAPTGIQADEIEAAGPDISGFANDLLAQTYGSRFSLRISTRRELKTKDGEADDLSIKVIDASRPSECDLRSLSGGEQVVVGEALRVGQALYANARLDRPFRTLWRDEPAGALDAENALHYVDMLRKARNVGEFQQVFVVAHNPSVIEAVDGVIRIDDVGGIAFRRNG